MLTESENCHVNGTTLGNVDVATVNYFVICLVIISVFIWCLMAILFFFLGEEQAPVGC